MGSFFSIMLIAVPLTLSLCQFFAAFFISASQSFPLIHSAHKASYFKQVDLRALAPMPSECLHLFLSGAISWLCSTHSAQ